MASKQFELEQVLKYRLDVERMRKLEFVVAKQEHEQAHERLLQEEAHVQDLSQQFCQCQAELKSIEEMQRYADFFARKREDIKLQKEMIDRLGCIMNDRRDHLLDATKDKKVLESLKEKKQKEFRLAMEQKEQLFMDEISIQKKVDAK